MYIGKLFASYMLLAILILSAAMSSYNISNEPKPVSETYLPHGWFTLKDKDRDYISDNLLSVQDNIVRAVLVFSTKVGEHHLNLIKALGGKIISGPWRRVLNGVSIEVPRQNLQSIREALLRTDNDLDGYSDLLFIEEDAKLVPDIHYAARQANIRPYVWNLGYKGKYVTIAIIDTGVDANAPGINRSRIVYSFDATNTNVDPLNDELDHGTHVASIIVGEYNGTYGNLILSGGPFSINGTAQQGHATIVLTPIPVYSRGKLRIEVYIAPYRETSTYNAFLYRIKSYGNILQAIKNNDLEYMLSNSTWETICVEDPKGNYYENAKTILSYNIVDENDYGNYVIGLFHDSQTFVYLWFNASVPSLISHDGYAVGSGIAPETSLAVFRVADHRGDIYMSYILNALDEISYVKDIYNISVVSISLSTTTYPTSLEQATRNLASQGIVIVGSAGNYGVTNNPSGSAINVYPSGFPWVISVGAVNGFNNLTYYTTIGGYSNIYGVVKPDLLAPGGDYDHVIYTSDSNDEGDTPFYNTTDENISTIDYEPLDYEAFTGTSASAPIVAGLSAVLISILRSAMLSTGLSLWEKLVQDYGIGASMLIKEIIESSCYETYPLIRTLNGTASYDSVREQYSPVLDRGFKDIYEGYGVLDAYAAVNYTVMLRDYLLYVYGLKNDYEYDYRLNDNAAPLIVLEGTLRNGVLYNTTYSSPKYNLPFGNSIIGVPVHFERFTIMINDREFISKYGVRIISDSEDPFNTDFDAEIYLINTSSWDAQLLNHTINGYGVMDELTYITPPVDEHSYDLIYYVAAKRATEDSAGGKVKIVIGPGLTAKFTDGRYIWINSTAASPPAVAKYGLVLVLYMNSSGVFLYKYDVIPTANLSGFAHIETYIDIIGANTALQDDWQWFVGVIYTSEPRTIHNITVQSIVEGPIYVEVPIGEPVKLYLSVPKIVMDHEPFKITAQLVLNDTDQPLPYKPVLFYESTDLTNWIYIGSAYTDSAGYAEITLTKHKNGKYYYIALYPGDSSTQFSATKNIAQVKVYGITALYINVLNTNPYTVEPVNISVKLFMKNSGEPISGEKVDIWVSFDDGATWHKIFSGITDQNGYLNYTHIFLLSGKCLLKANYTGNFERLYFNSESNIISISARRTPTYLNVVPSRTSVKVYDTVIFTTSLSYLYNGVAGSVKNAIVYLELYDMSKKSWLKVNETYTDSKGCATLMYRFTRNGTYIFRVHYKGNSTFIQTASNNIIVHVKRLNTSLIIIDKPIGGTTEKPLRLTAKLIDERNRPIKNSIIWLEKLVNGTWIKLLSNITNNNGEVHLSWTEDISGTYTYRLYYGGSDYVYAPSMINFTVVVALSPTSLSLTASMSETFINITFTLTAHLCSNKTPISNATIYFQKLINGTWITIGKNITSSTGYAVFKLHEPYAGSYTYRSIYYGNVTFGGSISNAVKITVNPAKTLLLLEAPEEAFVGETVLIRAILYTFYPFIKFHANQPVELWISKDGIIWIKLAVNYTNSNGAADFYISINNTGVYYLMAKYIDPRKEINRHIYNDTYSNIICINILKIPAMLILFANATQTTKDEAILLVARLVDNELAPIVNASIEFYAIINGTRIYLGSSTVNSTGYATLTASYQFVGAVVYVAVFNGTIKYRGASSNYVKVKYIERTSDTNNVFSSHNIIYLQAILFTAFIVAIILYIYRKKISKHIIFIV